jgi:quercetin dioxygenase-like cupin family protein
MPVIRKAESRRTETPAAVMTTLASPTLGEASNAVWRVDMKPGSTGPLHGIDAEQVWTVLDGAASVQLGPDAVTVGPGDTVIIPADLPRRVTADPQAGLVAIVAAPASMRAYTLDGTAVGEHCAVPDRDKLLPAWVA